MAKTHFANGDISFIWSILLLCGFHQIVWLAQKPDRLLHTIFWPDSWPEACVNVLFAVWHPDASWVLVRCGQNKRETCHYSSVSREEYKMAVVSLRSCISTSRSPSHPLFLTSILSHSPNSLATSASLVYLQKCVQRWLSLPSQGLPLLFPRLNSLILMESTLLLTQPFTLLHTMSPPIQVRQVNGAPWTRETATVQRSQLDPGRWHLQIPMMHSLLLQPFKYDP